MSGQKQLKCQSFVSQSSNSQDGSPHSEPSAKKRLVTLTTFEKDYDTLMWLCCKKSKEDGSLVTSLWCQVCPTFEENIRKGD